MRLFLTSLVLFFLISGLLAQTNNWLEIKPAYQKSFYTMVRTSVGGWPEDYFDQVKTFEKKEYVVRLWILTVDGSYTDCIIPGLGTYMGLYDRAIKAAKNDSIRSSLFSDEITGLITILFSLDRQIKTSVIFNNQAEYDFKIFLKKTKIDSSDEAWGDFVKTSPKYSKKWPGFFSTQVAWQKSDRSYDQYHKPEIKFLKGLEIKHELSLAKYSEILKTFPGQLANARIYAE